MENTELCQELMSGAHKLLAVHIPLSVPEQPQIHPHPQWKCCALQCRGRGAEKRGIDHVDFVTVSYRVYTNLTIGGWTTDCDEMHLPSTCTCSYLNYTQVVDPLTTILHQNCFTLAQSCKYPT